MKFTNQVVKNLDESEQQRRNAKGKSPPRPFALQPSPKPKARPVATMATGIFIEAIDQSDFKNKYESHANTPLQPIDEQKMYEQLMHYMDIVNTEPVFKANHKGDREKSNKKQVLFSSQKGNRIESPNRSKAKKIVVDHYASQQEKDESLLHLHAGNEAQQMSKRSSFGQGLTGFDKNDTNSSFNHIQSHTINEHGFMVKNEMTQSTKKELARGTILMNSSQNQLHHVHAENSPVDSHPGSDNVSPKLRLQGMSSGNLRQEQSVEKSEMDDGKIVIAESNR